MAFLNPPLKIEDLPEWVKAYLSPAKGKTVYRAHQFTINGVTYPFVRDLHFAATPDPINRRHSMYAGLYLTRPGDLLFFFQSDPQWAKDDIDSRRGLRGIYRIVSSPFMDTLPIEHPRTHYQILGACPHCGTFHANLSDECIICGRRYPSFIIPSKGTKDPYRFLHLSCRIDIEPLIIFERAVSDERAYADMSDEVMLWIGRHDNQMGAGKGSSIRQLLPEEALKLVRLMINEPGQRITRELKTPYPHPQQAIHNDDGTPGTDMLIQHRPRAGDRLALELSLNFHLARTLDDPTSKIAKALGEHLVHDDLEYISTEFPWGYTAGTSDFVYALRNEKGRYKIVVIELKKDEIDDMAFIQVSIYVQWVVQILTQYAQPLQKKIEVVPVVIGNKLYRNTSRPDGYEYDASFNSGAKLRVSVAKPIYIEYTPIDTYSIPYTPFNAKEQIENHYAKDIKYINKSDQIPTMKWQPPKGIVTSQIEKEWLLDTSWQDAKRNVKLNLAFGESKHYK